MRVGKPRMHRNESGFGREADDHQRDRGNGERGILRTRLQPCQHSEQRDTNPYAAQHEIFPRRFERVALTAKSDKERRRVSSSRCPTTSSRTSTIAQPAASRSRTFQAGRSKRTYVTTPLRRHPSQTSRCRSKITSRTN